MTDQERIRELEVALESSRRQAKKEVLEHVVKHLKVTTSSGLPYYSRETLLTYYSNGLDRLTSMI